MAAEGYALFGVSYDPVDVLATFAEKNGITYPLLADEGSRVIREIGLYNDHVFEQHAVYNIKPRDEHQGVAYPGVFVLDRDGVVVDKRFHQSYRERETGGALLESVLHIATPAHGPAAGGESRSVKVRVSLDSPTFAWFQRLRLTAELTVDEGMHVYGRPVPDGFTPVTIEVEPRDGIDIGEAEWPEPHRYTMEGLPEEFWVHEGTFRGSVPITFTANPGSGDRVIRGTVRFQACSDTFCLPPAEVPFELPVQEVGMVDRPLPQAT